MSAAREYFMYEPPEIRDQDEAPPQESDAKLQTFWHWFALGVLAFCWIAEASMCAERGF